MILIKNLNTVFLETCKKSNLPKIEKIITTASDNNIVLDIADGFLKACRHGRKENIDFFLNDERFKLIKINKHKGLESVVETNNIPLFKYLMNTKTFIDSNSIDYQSIFYTAFINNNTEIIKSFLVDYNFKPSSKLHTQLNSFDLDNFSYLKESKDTYSNILEIIKMNDSLNLKLINDSESFKPKRKI